MPETHADLIKAAIVSFGETKRWDPRFVNEVFILWHDFIFPLDHEFELNHMRRHLAERIAVLPTSEEKTLLTRLESEYLTLLTVDPSTVVDRIAPIDEGSARQ